MNLPDWWPSDKQWLVGDVLERLKELPDGVVQCGVTSPPYWGLRNYNVDGQLGLEKTPEEYVAKMVAVFREFRRVLRDDGVLWLNLGDSYCGSGGAGGDYDRMYRTPEARKLNMKGKNPNNKINGLKPKDLVGIPWMVAFALRADGWWLRQDIIWNKKVCMPESMTDRCTKSHEYIFLLTKSARYFYDHEAVKEGATPDNSIRDRVNTKLNNTPGRSRMGGLVKNDYATRNKRSVWTIAMKPYKGAHFAVFPPELPEICIKAGTSLKGACPKCGSPWERVVKRGKGYGKRRTVAGSSGQQIHPEGTSHDLDGPSKITIGWQPTCDCGIEETTPCVVMDVFAGSGTTIEVAQKLGRIGLGIELNPEYAELMNKRVNKGCARLDSSIWVEESE